MGNRLSKIYTRTGDDGSTGMADGSRVSKADNLFSVMGDIDELNSHIGLVRAHFAQAMVATDSNATPGSQKLPARLQPVADTDFGQALVIIQHLLFNIGGQLHVARTVCRRAERLAVLLQQQRPQAVRNTAISFINRLSDWLFVAARFCTDPEQVSEVLWNSQVLQTFIDNEK